GLVAPASVPACPPVGVLLNVGQTARDGGATHAAVALNASSATAARKSDPAALGSLVQMDGAIAGVHG
ncbi:MAG TPA: hypothetical protein VF099_01620, partial [Ktedonobacterales bacterium]